MIDARKWLEDARLAARFEAMVSEYDIYGGELEERAGGFWFNQLTDMEMAGLEKEERDACMAYVTSRNNSEAAAKCGWSEKWLSVILARACARIDEMLSVTMKYCCWVGKKRA